MKTWVIVASAARARFFELADRHAPLEEVLDLVSPKAPLPRQALESDRPGRAFDSRGGQRHAMETPLDPKQEVAMRFARQVVEALQTGLNEHRYAALCLVAPPNFLGLLREQMSAGLHRVLTAEIAKDLTREDHARIEHDVRAVL